MKKPAKDPIREERMPSVIGITGSHRIAFSECTPTLLPTHKSLADE